MAAVYPVNDPAYPPTAPPVPYGTNMGGTNPAQWMANTYEGGGNNNDNNTPGGLEILDDREMVRIEKLYSDLEEITSVSQPRTFKVLNDGSRQLFTMKESKDEMSSTELHRAFQVNCKDNSGKTLFKVIREEEKSCSYCFFCCACCGPCRTDCKVKVGSKVIGNIGQNCSVKSPSFTIYRGEETDVTLLNIEGNNKCMEMCAHYDLRYPDGNRVVGTLKKTGGGYGDHENSYYVHFPDSCDRELKIMCIAAMILFDYRFHNIYNTQPDY